MIIVNLLNQRPNQKHHMNLLLQVQLLKIYPHLFQITWDHIQILTQIPVKIKRKFYFLLIIVMSTYKYIIVHVQTD